MPPNYDIRDIVGHGRSQVSRSFPVDKVIDFTKRNAANTDTLDFHKIAGPVLIRSFTPILLTAEGAAATISLGTDQTGEGSLFAASLDMNAAPGVLAGPQTASAAYVQAELQAVIDILGKDNRLHGWYLATDCMLRITAAAPIATAKLRLIFDCYALDAA